VSTHGILQGGVVGRARFKLTSHWGTQENEMECVCNTEVLELVKIMFVLQIIILMAVVVTVKEKVR